MRQNASPAKDPDMGLEFIDKLIAYAELQETIVQKVAFYVVVFTMPFWFTLATIAKLFRGICRLCLWLYRIFSTRHNPATTATKRQKHQQR